MYYINKSHYDRYIDLLEEYKAIDKEGNIDNKFGSILYILASSSYLVEDLKQYIKNDINFTMMGMSINNQDDLILIRIMEDLYNNTNFIGIPSIMELPETEFKVVMVAMNIKKFNYTLDSIKYTRPGGRPKKGHWGAIQDCKKKGATQERTASSLGISLSTVKRNWK